MKQCFLVACVIGFALFTVGCNNDKDTPLVSGGETPGSQISGDPGTTGEPGSETGTPGTVTTDPTTGSTTGTTGAGSQSPLGTGALGANNPSINESGEMIKQEGSNPPPPGRVWCDNCKGHLPKADAVTKDGKNYCMACAEELKINK